jgi:hypothetical protein
MARNWLFAVLTIAAPLPSVAQAQGITRAPAIGEPGGGSLEVLCPGVMHNPSLTDKARGIRGQRAGDVQDEASDFVEPRAGTQAAPSARGVAEALNPQPLPPREAQVGGATAAPLGTAISLNPQPLPPRTSKVISGVSAGAAAAEPQAQPAPHGDQRPHD